MRKSTKGNLSTNLAAIQEEHGASSLASQDKNGAAAAAPRSGSLELGTKAPPKPAPRPPLPDGASRNQRGVNDGTSPAGTGTPQGGNSVSWRLSGTGLSGEGLSAGGQRDELGRRRSLDGLSMRDEEPMPEALDKVPGSMGAVVRTASNLNINPEAVEATALMSRFEEIKRKRHLSRFQGSFSVVHRQVSVACARGGLVVLS